MSDLMISKAPVNDALNSSEAIGVAASTLSIYETLKKEFLSQVARGGVKLTATAAPITRQEQLVSDYSKLESQFQAQQEAKKQLGEKVQEIPKSQGIASAPTKAEVVKAKDQIVKSQHLAKEDLKLGDTKIFKPSKP